MEWPILQVTQFEVLLKRPILAQLLEVEGKGVVGQKIERVHQQCGYVFPRPKRQIANWNDELKVSTPGLRRAIRPFISPSRRCVSSEYVGRYLNEVGHPL